MMDIICCLIIFIGPFFVYIYIVRRAGIVFWLLLIFGIFLFPMALLGIILFDSVAGLNPRVIYKSISNTFWPYCGLVLLFIAAVLAIGIFGHKVKESRYLAILVYFVSIYLIYIAAHLLGRFYWKYQEKLKWDVRL